MKKYIGLFTAIITIAGCARCGECYVKSTEHFYDGSKSIPREEAYVGRPMCGKEYKEYRKLNSGIYPIPGGYATFKTRCTEILNP
jgi:hypothetical protein